MPSGERNISRACLEIFAVGLMAESVAQSALMNSPNQIEAVMANSEKRMPKFSDPT